MRKTYQLTVEGKNPDRLLDAAKHDIRKYFKRERVKALPLGADLWAFDCRCGADTDTAQAVAAHELPAAVDALVRDGAQSFYVEILARPAQRAAWAPDESASHNGAAPLED